MNLNGLAFVVNAFLWNPIQVYFILSYAVSELIQIICTIFKRRLKPLFKEYLKDMGIEFAILEICMKIMWIFEEKNIAFLKVTTIRNELVLYISRF